MNAAVWLNGESLGSHPYGYTSFWYRHDRQVQVRRPERPRREGPQQRREQPLVFRLRNLPSRWLRILDPVHVAQWGTYVRRRRSVPRRPRSACRRECATDSGTAASVALTTRILDPEARKWRRRRRSRRSARTARRSSTQERARAEPCALVAGIAALYRATYGGLRVGQLARQRRDDVRHPLHQFRRGARVPS